MAKEIVMLSSENLISNKTKVGLNNRVKELAHQMSAILFACGEGLQAETFCEKLGVSKPEVELAIKFMQGEYSGENGIHLIKYKNKYQLTTNPDYANEVALVLNPIREKNLTKAALEAMAIVAYKQPITRLEIDQIRGVGSDYALQILIQSGLVEIVGRKEILGRPLLYGTTDNFLKRFGLESIETLPSYEDLLAKIKVIRNDENKEVEIYESKGL